MATTILKTQIAGFACLVCLLWCASAPAVTPAELERVTRQLNGRWDATPSLDLDRLMIRPPPNPELSRANELGARATLMFDGDGKYREMVQYRDGPADGTHMDRLVGKQLSGTWKVLEIDGDVAIVQFSPANGKPFKEQLILTGPQSFTVDVPDLAMRMLRTPAFFRRNHEDAATMWVRNLARDGPDSRMVADMTREIKKFVAVDDDFTIRFGSDLLKTGKAQQFSMVGRQWFVFDLTATQSKQLGLAHNNVSVIHSRAENVFPSRCDIDLAPLEADPDAVFDLNRPLVLSVTFDLIHRISLGDGDASCSIRIRGEAGDAIFSQFTPINHSIEGKTTLKAKLNWPDNLADYKGPVALFVDVCRETHFSNGESAMLILSDTVALLRDAEHIADR